MQLKNIGKARSIVLATGLALSSSAFPFSYDLLNHSTIKSVIQDRDTSRYINDLEGNSYDNLLLNMRFQEHYKSWSNKTLLYSNVKSIIEDSDFQAIVAMGELATPFIIKEIERKSSLLVWALNIIYNKKISDNPQTTIEEACKLWLKELKA